MKPLTLLEFWKQDLIQERAYKKDHYISTNIIDLKIEEVITAIEELKLLEKRSCGDCKYIKKYNETLWECKKDVKTNYFTNYIEHSFCCNKWESR